MVKNNPSLDTNIILRLLLEDVPSQLVQVNRLFEKPAKYHVADVVLSEAVFVMENLYQMDRDAIVTSLVGIVRHPQVICNKGLFEHILPLYASESALSVIDCMLLGYARLNKAIPLYTFDKKLVSKSEGDAVHP
jgi:predicted nucleic-acid-binding protein